MLLQALKSSRNWSKLEKTILSTFKRCHITQIFRSLCFSRPTPSGAAMHNYLSKTSSSSTKFSILFAATPAKNDAFLDLLCVFEGDKINYNRLWTKH